jgi:two-component system chemotaxis response regulator CheB
MSKVRVLVTDDAVVVRKMLSEVLASDSQLDVVGTAANGRIALAKLSQVNPDVVILDVEMPEMDGLETLKAIRKSHPLLPVIMFSTLTQRGMEVTLDALALGANDYVTKPANVGSIAMAQQRIRDELIPKIKLFGGRSAGLSAALAPKSIASAPRAPSWHDGGSRIGVVAIGVSTGGPNALAELLPNLPAQFGVPVVIVQHMPPLFTRFLSDRLNANCALEVGEGAAGKAVEPGQVWLAPGDFHMTVARDGATVRLRTSQTPPENSCRPAVDVLFRSVAQVYGPSVLAVVLTGMGQDGLRGCEWVREAGGQVWAQDEASSVVWGMPGAVVGAGLAQRVLPLNQLGPEVARVVARSRGATMTALSRT